ncbi:MAG: asparagine synthase (glutamine-hydrolyzing) [Lachnospiraceae bacterium]|nr:asparagine synthase (glutamine-hydrolyzing) [Lachnospiraceae bacterium]
MCGISVCCDLTGNFPVNTLKKMNDVIRHRGPDDEGFVLVSDKSVAFAGGRDCKTSDPFLETVASDHWRIGIGHRRLSILDLSTAGHQPMKKGNYVAAFNGEIYNYIELREQLIQEGEKFISDTDTEVLLAAYQKWGKECVKHLNGMWAFCIYDLENREMFISRDRFGVKPLYCCRKKNKILFASEIKQILEDDTVKRQADEEVLAHFILYGLADYSQRTCFKNIRCVKAGTNIRIQFSDDLKQVVEWKEERYYKPGNHGRHAQVKEIGAALERAVKLRLRSDAPIGSCLSGGLDSSTIVAIASENLGERKMKTFTSHFPDIPQIDETEYSDAVNEFLGCEGYKVLQRDQDILERLKKVIWHQDEPNLDFHLVTQYEVFQEAKKNHCSVVLDGQGGDETLAGYYSYYATYIADLFRKGNIRQTLKKARKICKASAMSYKELVKYVFYFNNWKIRQFYIRRTRGKYVTKRVKDSVNADSISMFIKKKSSIEQQLCDLQYGSLPALLHHEDRNSMAHSVESRVPFLDVDYVETALSVSITDKISNGYTKVPLRTFINKRLPDKVVWRKNKLGFPAPSEKWLYKIPDEAMKDFLGNARSKKFFEVDKLCKIYEKKDKDNIMLRRFLTVELWMRMFQVEAE